MAYDFSFTEEQQLVRDSLRGFIRDEIYPREDEVYALGDVPAPTPWASRPARCRTARTGS